MGNRRRRMHGKRRRQFSNAPFKHIISMKTEDQHDHPHPDEDADASTSTITEAVADPDAAVADPDAISEQLSHYSSPHLDPNYKGLRTEKEAFEFMQSQGLTHDHIPISGRAKELYEKLNPYEAPTVRESSVSSDPGDMEIYTGSDTSKPVEPKLQPYFREKFDITAKQDETPTRLESLPSQVYGKNEDVVKTMIMHDIMSGNLEANINESRKNHPETWEKWDAEKAAHDAKIEKRETKLDALQIGLSVGGVGFPPLDIVNAVVSGGRSLHSGLTGDWDAAKEHGVGAVVNVLAAVPILGDALQGVHSSQKAADLALKAGKYIKESGKAQTWIRGAKQTVDDMTGLPGRLRDKDWMGALQSAGQWAYWFDPFGSTKGTIPASVGFAEKFKTGFDEWWGDNEHVSEPHDAGPSWIQSGGIK